jgi:hypothetical protein
MKKLALPFVLAVAIMILSACAPSNGKLTINESWARPAAKGQNGAAYFVIQNGTTSDDALLSVNSDIAAATEVHMSMMNANEVMTMRMQESVLVPAQGKVEFKPGGLHVMFNSLTQELKVGDRITLTWNFKEAGSITIQAPVKEP